MAEYPSLTSAVEPLALGEPVVAAAWLGDTPAFALADGAIRLGEAHEERRVQAHPDAAILVAASDGRRLITGGDDGRVVGTDADGAIETIAEEKGKWIDAVAIHEGAIAWSAGRSAHARSAKGEVKSVDLPSTCRGLAFFPKGYRLAASHYNGATIWFPNAGKPELLNWSGSHLDATVSPDGRFLITSMQENTLHGWRIADAKNMRMAGYPGKTRSFSWSNDGKWLATSGADACIIWPFSGKDGPMGQSSARMWRAGQCAGDARSLPSGRARCRHRLRRRPRDDLADHGRLRVTGAPADRGPKKRADFRPRLGRERRAAAFRRGERRRRPADASQTLTGLESAFLSRG